MSAPPAAAQSNEGAPQEEEEKEGELDVASIMQALPNVASVTDLSQPGDASGATLLTMKLQKEEGSSKAAMGADVMLAPMSSVESWLAQLRAPTVHHAIKYVETLGRRAHYADPDQPNSADIENSPLVRRILPLLLLGDDELDRRAHLPQAKPRLKMLLGDMLMYGLMGCERDANRACNLWNDAADAGCAEAQTQVAMLTQAVLNRNNGLDDPSEIDYKSARMVKDKLFEQILYWLGCAAQQGHFSPFALFLLRQVSVQRKLVDLKKLAAEGVQGAAECDRALRKAMAAREKEMAKEEKQKAGAASSSSSSSSAASSAPAPAPGSGSHCCSCQRTLTRADFSANQLKKPSAQRTCKECRARQEEGKEGAEPPGSSAKGEPGEPGQ